MLYIGAKLNKVLSNLRLFFVSLFIAVRKRKAMLVCTPPGAYILHSADLMDDDVLLVTSYNM